jgi:hypothetical protein
MAAESADWDPCGLDGLCDFVTNIDSAIQAGDLGPILGATDWKSIHCGTAESDFGEWGIQPTECRDWPLAEPIPAILVGLAGSEGSLVSRSHLRGDLEEWVAMNSALGCTGSTSPTGVRAVIESPDSTFVYAGEVSLILGPPIDCEGRPATFPVHYLLSLRSDPGHWVIQAFLRMGGAGILMPSRGDHQLYVKQFRYYPLN